ARGLSVGAMTSSVTTCANEPLLFSSGAAYRATAALGIDGKALEAGLKLPTEVVQCERDEVVVAHEHGQLDELPLVVPRGQCGPRVVRDARVGVQLVGRAEEHAFELLPAVGVGPRLHAADLVVGDVGGPGDEDVLAPFVVRTAQPRGAQDGELALARRDPPAQQLPAEREPPAEEAGVAHEGAEDVRGEGARHDDPLEQLPHLLVVLSRREGLDAGVGRATDHEREGYARTLAPAPKTVR